jgi:GeoRSP system PqqD family protein
MRKILRNPDVLWREEDDAREEAIAGLERGEDVGEVGTSLLFAGGQMLMLNMLGTEIWQRCDGNSLDGLVMELMLEFEVEEPQLRTDVTAFLAELEEKGFISYGA